MTSSEVTHSASWVGWHLVHGGWAVLMPAGGSPILISHHIDPLPVELGSRVVGALGFGDRLEDLLEDVA